MKCGGDKNCIMKKLKAGQIQGTLATIQFRIFCLPLTKRVKIKIHKTIILPAVFLWMALGLLH
jgi:hypothetical protein